eukprot:gene21103-27345_t
MNTASSGSHTRTSVVKHVEPIPVIGGGARKLLESYLNDVLHNPHTNAIKKRSRKIDSVETPYLTMETTSEVFASTPFEEQLVHPLTNSIPLLSESAIANRHLNPLHDTKHKKMIFEVCSRIKRDDTEMRRCRLNSERVDDFICQQISLSLYKNTNLQQLELHDNNITDDGAHSLSKAVGKHPNLLSLWLGNNRLTDIAAMHIATMISKNSVIKEINLSNKWPPATKGAIELEAHPRITHIGAQHIADVLKNTKDVTLGADTTAAAVPGQPTPRSNILTKGNHNTLMNLCLADQRIGTVGAVALFHSLEHCNLKQLNLSGNELTDECCSSLRQALENPASVLQSLNVSRNAITDIGLQDIITALTMNQTLLSLNISANRITDDGLDALYCCLIQSNEVLTRVQTTNNIGTDSRAEMYASRRLLTPSNPMSKKDSGNNLHDLLHNKSMTSAKKTFTFSTAGSNGKLPQLTDDNIVADSPAPMAVVDAESDDSEESEEEEMDEEQGASEHTVSTSTTIGQGDSPKSSEKANSLREKSRTVKFPSNLVEDAEEKAPSTESTSKHGDSNKGVLAKSKTVKNSAKDFDWMNSGVPAARSNSGGGSGTASALIRIDNRGNKFLTYEKKLVNFFTPPSAMLPPHLRPLADKEPGLPMYQREGGRLVTSADQLGNTIGVPYLTNLTGIRPLRSNVSEHSDSAQHFAYIKVFASPRKGSAG